MNATKILACYFDAPMQSYGVESRFDYRTTLTYPSRSVVSGIVCAAMGIDQNDDVFLDRFAKLKVVVLELQRKINNQKEVNISDLCDFHTVGGGYDESLEYDEILEDARLFIPSSTDRKKMTTVVSFRYYLTDARFGVLISGDDAQIEKFDAALRNPVWGVWFGRKCCIPASPIAQGVYEDFDKAVKKLCELAGCEAPRRVVRDAESCNEDGALTYMDVPRTFAQSQRGTGEQFGLRRIVVEDWETFRQRKEGKAAGK